MPETNDWREELANQRDVYVTTEETQQAAWAAMLDATSTDALAEHIIKKVSRAELRAIVSEWLSQQDFCHAMSGVEGGGDA
jgi:hypothetical protein